MGRGPAVRDLAAVFHFARLPGSTWIAAGLLAIAAVAALAFAIGLSRRDLAALADDAVVAAQGLTERRAAPPQTPKAARKRAARIAQPGAQDDDDAPTWP